MSHPDPTARAAALLRQLRDGDAAAAEELFPLVYAELRRLAGGYLRADRLDHTLQPTALVHEAWFRLSEGGAYEGREHFLAVAATAMRQILVDHARARAAAKRGGDRRRETIAGLPEEDGGELDLLDLEGALEQLATTHPRPARVVELRFFAGLEVEEVARVLAVSERTIKSDWRFARAWLRREIDRGTSS